MLLSAHIYKFLIVFRALTFFKAYNGIYSDGIIGTFLFIVKKYFNKYASAYLCSPLVVLIASKWRVAVILQNFFCSSTSWNGRIALY